MLTKRVKNCGVSTPKIPCLASFIAFAHFFILGFLLVENNHFVQCAKFSVKHNYREKEKQILDDILGPGKYDKRIRPSGVNSTADGGATTVMINLMVRSIARIDDVTMLYMFNTRKTELCTLLTLSILSLSKTDSKILIRIRVDRELDREHQHMCVM
ncbi:hypothetical protein Anas_09754 [Armadillidium nasatum]|uniref:Uncharacterized protein n=1 Tax=Armadillidium nasatum TaxID=96803 RepID=A0A5N5TG96_9CRUS|nr:hypothetical protein Anas_09754 [Armadillidium nasatum]